MSSRKRKNNEVHQKTDGTPKKGKMSIKAEEVEDSPDADLPVWCLKKAQEEKPSRQCPYLDTIDRLSLIFHSIFHILFRGVLDFDFEKLCSISLSHVNVYACMVCGKYFQVF